MNNNFTYHGNNLPIFKCWDKVLAINKPPYLYFWYLALLPVSLIQAYILLHFFPYRTDLQFNFLLLPYFLPIFHNFSISFSAYQSISAHILQTCFFLFTNGSNLSLVLFSSHWNGFSHLIFYFLLLPSVMQCYKEVLLLQIIQPVMQTLNNCLYRHNEKVKFCHLQWCGYL